MEQIVNDSEWAISIASRPNKSDLIIALNKQHNFLFLLLNPINRRNLEIYSAIALQVAYNGAIYV